MREKGDKNGSKNYGTRRERTISRRFSEPSATARMWTLFWEPTSQLLCTRLAFLAIARSFVRFWMPGLIQRLKPNPVLGAIRVPRLFIGLAWRVTSKLPVFFYWKLGANAESTTDKGNTALHFACNRGHLAVVQLLVNAGATMDAQAAILGQRFIVAADKGHMDVVQLACRPMLVQPWKHKTQCWFHCTSFHCTERSLG